MRTYIPTCPSIYHQEASYAIRPPYAIPITVSISISIPFPELVAHTHFNTHGALHLEARTLNLLVQSVPRSTTYIHTPIHPYTLSYLHTCHPHTHTRALTHTTSLRLASWLRHGASFTLLRIPTFLFLNKGHNSFDPTISRHVALQAQYSPRLSFAARPDVQHRRPLARMYSTHQPNGAEGATINPATINPAALNSGKSGFFFLSCLFKYRTRASAHLRAQVWHAPVPFFVYRNQSFFCSHLH